MKTPLKFVLSALVAVSGLTVGTLSAQQEPPPPPPMGHGQPPQDFILKMLTEKLSLTEAQQTKIKAILEDERTAMDVLRETASDTDREQIRTQAEALRKMYREQIRAALTADQQKIFDQLKPARRGPPPPSPSGTE